MMYRYLTQAQITVLIYSVLATSILLLCVEDLMILCRQDPHVARAASSYCTAASLGVIPCYVSDTFRKFFVNVNRTSDIQDVQILVAALHIVWCYLFVGFFQLQNTGVGLANSLTNCGTCIVFGYRYW
ncbi:unnamed protein product, partial [Amoebophrya sp. A25]|eukprot:GSA25T00009221001.1